MNSLVNHVMIVPPRLDEMARVPRHQNGLLLRIFGNSSPGPDTTKIGTTKDGYTIGGDGIDGLPGEEQADDVTLRS